MIAKTIQAAALSVATLVLILFAVAPLADGKPDTSGKSVESSIATKLGDSGSPTKPGESGSPTEPGEPTKSSTPAEPWEEGEDGGPQRSIDYFNQWIGEPLTPERLHQMWDEVLATPSEPPAGAQDFVNSWELIGPLYSVNPGSGYMTGRVRDIEASTTRVLAASGGLWRFHFGPIPMTESIPASWFGSFSSKPGDSNTILVGTGEYLIGSGTGLYKTLDGGATWMHAYMTPEPAQFHKVRWSPTGAVAYAATTSGFYRSTDGGLVWSRTLTANVTDLSTDDSGYYPNLVYACVYNDGLHRSNDAGVTWSKMTDGGIPLTGTQEGAVSTPAHSPFVPGWIYVSFVNAGVWRSTDGGATWANITPASDPHRFWYANVIVADRWENNYVLLGGVGARVSADGGATWTALVTPNLHADYHAFSWNSDGVGVWAGNDGGWFHSTDHGFTWDSSANVMPITQFYNIDCEKSEIGYMIGGTQDNDLVYTPTQDLFWSDKGEGDGAGVSVDLYTLGRMWGMHGVFGGNLSYHRERTTNGGVSWQEVDNGIDPNTNAGVIRGDNGFNPWLITSAGPHVYDSVDLGDTWTKSNTTPFPSNIANLTSSTRVNPNAVAYACMAGVVGGQSLFVRDGGVWVDRSAGLPVGYTVRKVVPHPWSGNYADEAWALMNGISNPGQKIYHTTNRGVTWTNATGDLPNVPVGDLVVNPRSTNQLVLGSMLGCYRSIDGGAHWERWNNGLPPSVMVTEMSYIDLTPSDGPFYVVAATHGRSAWRRIILGTDPAAVENAGAPLPLDLSIANPVVERATLQFFLPQAGPARIEVYDVRGERVATVLDATVSQGRHEIELDGRTLAPGVFFCRLDSGDRTVVRKITVVR